jgi:chemosensory pili system protein ChpA (sensor histidine kinase/response regulator)
MSIAQQDLDYTTLKWVKDEIRESLEQTRQALEAYVENPDDETQIRFCATYLHQIYGTLQMVEIYGGALLAEEMELLANAISQGKVTRKEDAYDVLMRAILQLPAYLEHLENGQQDMPVILLPLLNDLRTSRGEHLLSENAFFSPNLFVTPPESTVKKNKEPVDIQKYAKKLRPVYQAALVRWYRDISPQEAISKLSIVIRELLNNSSDDNAVRLWWVASGIVEGLMDKGLEASSSVKQLMGHQIDRQIKRIIDGGEDELNKNPPVELLKNLLYYVATSTSSGARTGQIKSTFNLDHLLPGSVDVNEAFAQLRGSNADLMQSVSAVIKEDLLNVKDQLDIFVRDKDKPVAELAPLSENLNKVSDTLAMLGLGDLHKIIQDQNRSVNELIQAGSAPSEMSLMEIASALLYVESSLEGVQSAASSRVLASDKESETLLPPSEQKQLNNLVIGEATKLVLEVKEAFNAYAVDTTLRSTIQSTPDKLDQVRGVLAILGLTRAANLLHAATDYIRHQLLREDIEPNQKALDLLADVITSIEYFLEAVAENRGHPESILQVAESSAQALGYTPEAISDMEASQADIVAPTEIIDAGPLDLESAISEVVEILDTDGLDKAIAEDSAETEQHVEPAAQATPVATPAATPAVSTPAASAEPAAALPEDDIDEEILEIFLEEADEVVGTMKENLAAWKRDNGNNEALSVLRRSYHTIKGSGRLAGAKVVGEFAWAIENMLNKIIDGRVETKPEVFELMGQAEATLEASIKHLKGELDAQPPVQQLIAQAEAYANGEDILVAEKPDLIDELLGDMGTSPEPEELEVSEETELTLEAPEEELSFEPAEVVENKTVQQEVVDETDASQNDKLIDIFRKETTTHLAAINNYIIGFSDDNLQTVSEPLMRALHTLHGSANMATVDNVAEISEHLDRYFSTLYETRQPVISDAVDVLTQGSALIKTMMEGIDDDSFESPNIRELVARINELHEEAKEFEPPLDSQKLSIMPGNASNDLTPEFIEQQGDGLGDEIEIALDDANMLDEVEARQETTSEFDIEEIHSTLEEIEPEEEAVVESAPDASGFQVEEEEVDEELISIFLDEAEEILRNNEALIQGWTSDLNDRSIMEELQRGLHTLKGGARMANLVPIANLAHSIESLLESIFDGTAISSPQLPKAIQRCQDWFSHSLETVRAGKQLEEATELRNLIQTFIDGLEPVEIETETPQFVEEPDEEISLAEETPEQEEEIESITLESVEDGAVEESFEDSVEEIELSEVTMAPLEETTSEDEDDDLLNIFLEEAADIQDQNEAIILKWVNDNNNLEYTTQLQRSLHTLKGSARMARVSSIADVAHAMESVLERVNDKQLGVVSDLPIVIQKAQDWIGNALALANKHAEMPDPSDLITSIDDYSMVSSEQEEPAQDEEIVLVEEALVEAETEEPEVEAPSFEIEEKLETVGATAIEPEATPASAEEVDYDEELVEIFLEEAEEIQENVDRLLHEWVNDIQNKEMVAEIQRSLHTLKGGARMANIAPIGDLSHAVESLMEAVTEGRLSPTDEYPKTIQICHDWLAGAIAQVKQQQPVSGADFLIKQLENLLAGNAAMHGLSAAQAKESAAKARESGIMEAPPVKETIKKKAPEKVKESKPVDPSKLISLPGFSAADDNDASVEPTLEETKQRATEEQMRVRADLIDNMVNHAGEINIFNARIGQQLGQWHFNLKELEQTIGRLRDQLRNFEMETEAQIMYQHSDVSASTVGSGSSSAAAFDPLELDRFSHMQQLSRSMVESFDDLISIQKLLEGTSGDTDVLLLQQSRINSDLQEELISTRLTPFSSVIARLRRVVRQTCQETGKEADLQVNGAEGEMDRTQLNRIVPALEHILRNAIDHGLEQPAARKKAKKSETGSIQINFTREGSEVVLRIIDDGAGINVDTIRKKAIERGLIDEKSKVEDDEVLDFILQSGFSTAEKVTQISGRGVGMDVVNTEIKQLNGSLHIATEQGKGSTFTIRLPLTVLVNQALMVHVDEAVYAISLSNIEHVIRVPNDEINAMISKPGSDFEYAGHKYQHLHIGYVLHGSAPAKIAEKGKQPLLLARSGDHRVALQVDNLIGRQEIVIKSVGPQLSSINSISGATILPDGEVALILDLSTLIRTSHTLQKADDTGQIREAPAAAVVEKQPTVLIVDDSITVRKVTQRLMNRNNYEPVTAKDGMDALTVMLETIPDIILLDVEMPRMDGYELATAVRSDPRLKHIPIIMITSRTGDKHRDRALSIGVNMYMGKPFQEHELLENIQSLLQDQ